MRTSGYTIYADLPENSEEVLLVHGYTGAYDKVSRSVAEFLRSLESGRPPRPLYGNWSPDPPVVGEVKPPSEQTVALLKKRGYLTEKTQEEEEKLLEKITSKVHQISTYFLPNYVFMPTYDCNLRCAYCFQHFMRTNPSFKHLLRTMSTELVDRIFQAIPKMDAYHEIEETKEKIDKTKATSRSMGFFGGEPLLEQSYPIVKYIYDKAQKLDGGKVIFWGVTNGTDLNFYKDLLGENKISQLQITLDGPPSEHDKRRIYADGRGSYQIIANNITMALDKGVMINIRMNIDKLNIECLPELADDITSRGWDKYENFGAYAAPIHKANDKTDAKTTMTSWALDKALTKMREDIPNMKVIMRPDDSLKDMVSGIFDRTSISMPSFKSSFCGAHTKMYLFDAFGDIYACWERTGDSKIRTGYITPEGGFSLNELNKKWRSRTVTTNSVCKQCRYALYCGGGCAVQVIGHRDGFYENYCDGFSARFRSVVAEAFLEYRANGSIQNGNQINECDL